MLKRFLYLQQKSFFRGAGVATNVLQKILRGFVWVYFAFVFTGLAFIAFHYPQEELGVDPLVHANGYVLYGFVYWLVMRYFFQKMPLVHTQPLLVLPVSKNSIIRFGLFKTLFSFFNLGNLFFFIPFGVLLIQEDYTVSGVIGWWVSLASIILLTNFLNIMLNSIDRVLFIVASVLIGFFALQYFEVFDLSAYTAPVFMAPYNQPLWALVPVGLLAVSIRWSVQYFKQQLYLDNHEKKSKKEKHRSMELGWLDGFGRLAVFLRNDIRLIMRNKRARMTVWMGFAFVFYGFLFMTDIYSGAVWQIFVGIFVTGGFLFSFGQFVPSWDSSYYPLMMTQNVPYREYLTSKWWLVVVGTLVGMLLGSIYAFFSWETYLAILAGGVYNIGVNAYLVLLSGAYTRTPIDLTSTQKAFGDKKSFNLKTLLLSVPKIALPMFMFYVGVILGGKLLGIGMIAATGIVGFALRNVVFKWIEHIYKNEKHLTLEAYKQKNA